MNSQPLVSFFQQYGLTILQHTLEHLFLVGLSIAIAILLGIPLGILITRQPRLAQPVLGLANIIQTIPSLALFGFLIPVPVLGGIGITPAIIALTLYALMPIIRNTYTGILSVEPAIREAGQGMGMTDRQLLTMVELPLALGLISVGVRVATGMTIGLATIAAAIGAGGLGVLIFQGISTVNHQLILAGAVPAALMALLADFILAAIEKKLTWRQSLESKRSNRKSKLGWRWAILSLALITCIIAIAFPRYPTIVIGSKNFTEQIILGELLAQKIENQTGLKVERKFNLGGTFICHQALLAGQIDSYIEYTGTALTAILKQKPITEPQKVYQKVKQNYARQFNLEVAAPLGFNNTFAIIIRSENAKKYNLQTLSEAAKYTPQWQAGFGYEFLTREDGFPGLAKTYGLRFATPPQVMDLGLMYQALAEKKVDLIAGDSTNGLIDKLNLVVLQDDRHYFPPYEAVPIIRQHTLKRYPQIQKALDSLGDLISDAEMRKLNYLVDGESRPVAEVVKQFLNQRLNHRKGES